MMMSDYMKMKGIKMEDFEPATEGKTRSGRIRKEMKLYNPFTSDVKYSIVGVEINTRDKTIEVQFLKGSIPIAKALFLSLLADRDVRRLIKEYQVNGRKSPYKIWNKSGMFNKNDVFITIGNKIGGFSTTNIKKLCHISSCGRLDEGFGNNDSKMYIGDFVELCVFLGLTEDMNIKNLRKKSKVKYIRPRLAEELADFKTEVSKIL